MGSIRNAREPGDDGSDAESDDSSGPPPLVELSGSGDDMPPPLVESSGSGDDMPPPLVESFLTLYVSEVRGEIHGPLHFAPDERIEQIQQWLEEDTFRSRCVDGSEQRNTSLPA